MATLRDIRRRINAVANTAKITQAMRMVSAAKLRRADEAIKSARPYSAKIQEMLSNLIVSVGENYEHPLIQKRKQINNVAIVVISSDRGLCGSFNTSLFRYVNRYIQDEIQTEFPDLKNIYSVLVGRRATASFRPQNIEILKEYPGFFQKIEFHKAKDMIELLTEQFISNKIDKVIVFYNWFKNLIAQVPSRLDLLPIEPKVEQINKEKFNVDYIFEPDRKSILDELLPKNLEIQMWKTILESNAAEQAARMMAMENATNNAKDLIKYLELVFNKERQAAITKEMLEIVGGANALKKG